jgi:hypothetical protein
MIVEPNLLENKKEMENSLSRVLFNDDANWLNYPAPEIKEWINMKHCWNDTDREKPMYSEKNLSQRHFIHNKSHMDWVGMFSSLPGERPETNCLNHGTALKIIINDEKRRTEKEAVIR